MPAWLNLRRLEGRIVALFLGLLLVVQIVSFVTIRASITQNAENSVAAELKTGERVLRRLLDQRAGKLRDASELLAKDYGFRSTIGGALFDAEMAETVKDALANQGERVGASVVAYFDDKQRLIAATQPGAEAFGPVLRGLVSRNEGTVLSVQGSQAYQVVAVQVRTPAPVGWVLMGFLLNREALAELKGVSELDSALLLQVDRGAWVNIVNELAPAQAAALRRELGTAEPADSAVVLAGERMRTHFVSLLSGDPRLGVLVLRSLDAALAPYQQLQLVLLGLSVLGVVVFAIVSVLLARGISGPITTLSAAARRLEGGDYDTPVPALSRLEEVNKLAVALESMRDGIQRRDAQVNHLAYVDQLTLLPNRARFAQVLQYHLLHSTEPGAVLVLNLARVKRVNNLLGRDMGDQLLRNAAERLHLLCAPAQSMLARFQGDEFAILLTQADMVSAALTAAHILQDFEHPVHVANATIDLGAGIGIALFPRDGVEVNKLLERAELAMHAAKKGRLGSLVYSPQLDVDSGESLSLRSELRQALEQQELRMYLQPKIDLKRGHVVGAEALVRWQHPERGLVPPMQFIPFAEQTGFIRELTAWVLRQAVLFVREAIDAGLAVRLSVNLSTHDLLDVNLVSKLRELLGPLEVPPNALCLEITESAIMDDPERALNTLKELAEMNFKLSIDDFGTGYSSLAYLQQLPVHELKIDQSFVRSMDSNPKDARIVDTIIKLAHNLNLSVVAEGVETGKSWNVLAGLGCDEGQGWFFGRPMPQNDFIAWAKSWQPPDRSHLGGQSILAALN